MKYRGALVFDMDGTVLDSKEPLAALGARVIAQFWNLPLHLARAGYDATVGLPFVRQLEHMFPGSRDHVRRQYAASAYERAHASECKGFSAAPGIEEALHEAYRVGYHLSLVSSTARALVSQAVWDLPWHAVFGVVAGMEKQQQVEQVLALRAWSEIRFFGDTDVDQQIAQCLGVDFEMTDCQRCAAAVRRYVRAKRA